MPRPSVVKSFLGGILSSGRASGLNLPFGFRLSADGEYGKASSAESAEAGEFAPPAAIRLPKPLPNLEVVLATRLLLGNEQFLAHENLGRVGDLVGVDDPPDARLVLEGDAAHGLPLLDLVNETLLRVIVRE